MSLHPIALLDPPSPSSFGIVPFVAERDDGVLLVCGFKGRPREDLERRELSDLLADGHAVQIEVTESEPSAEPSWVAGWLGEEFRRKARFLRAPSINTPKRATAQGGSFWFGPLAEVYDVLDSWLREAACDCFQSERGPEKAELAKLMQWALPNREETQAAVWYTRASELEQGRELAWFQRLRKDAGRPISANELKEEFRLLVGSYRGVVARELAQKGGGYPRKNESPLLAA